MNKSFLHDNNAIKNSVNIALINDTYTINNKKINDIQDLQSFLSCSAVISKTYPLSIDNIYFTKPTISTTSKSRYRAAGQNNDRVSTALLGFDGVAGPEIRDTIYIIGIDPGISGAMAVLKLTEEKLFFGAVFDMPTYILKVSDKNRKRIDLTGLANLLDLYSASTKFAMIEDVASMPTDGHVGAFSFGFATGVVHGALAMAGVKIEKVKPAIWKSFFGLDSDKQKSFQLCLKLFPESQKYLTRKQDHGRAEAILLAWFAFKHMRKA